MAPLAALLKIQNIEFENGAVSVSWRLEADGPSRLRETPFELRLHRGADADSDRYEQAADPDETIGKCAVFAFLSVALPLLSLDYKTIDIVCPWEWTGADRDYWEGLLRRLGFDPGGYRFLGDGPAVPLRYRRQTNASPSLALFYGGGIESNAALTSLLAYRPALFIVEGPAWMNNNTSGELHLKRELELRVAREQKLDLIYARMNIRDLTPSVSDALLNHFCTGGMFYWLAAAAGLSGGIPLFLIAQEFEYTLIRERFDKSLTPHHLFWNHHAKAPLLLPVLGWSASIELLDLLRDSPLLESLYSCFHNSEHRWCGQCTKCYRVFEWARRLGIDPVRFGMCERATGTKRGSQLYRLHWQTSDQLYPVARQPEGQPGLVGLTDIALIDLVHIGLYRCDGGRVEFQGEEMTVHPAGDSPAEVYFDSVEFRGFDEFECAVVSAGGSWRISLDIQNAFGEPLAGWARTLHGRSGAGLGQSFPELTGPHRLVLSVQGLRSPMADQSPPPRLILPTFRRRQGA